jgi:hypothetical protein
MAIEFLGHTPSYSQWVFKINGNRFVGRNFSSPSPLSIKFSGFYPDSSPLAGGLVKTSGFDVLSGTSQVTSSGDIGGIVEWVWGGRKYRNRYLLTLGDVGAEEESTLQFDAPIPYDGPVGGPLTPPPAQQPPAQQPPAQQPPAQQPPAQQPPAQQPPANTAADNAIINDLKRELAQVNRSLAVSEEKRMVDANELNKARAAAQGLQVSLNDAKLEVSQIRLNEVAELQAQLNDAVQKIGNQFQTASRDQAIINDLQNTLADTNTRLKAAEQNTQINASELVAARAAAKDAIVSADDAKQRISSGYNTMILKLQGEIADALVRVQTNYERVLKAEEENSRLKAEAARTKEEADRKLAEANRLAEERKKSEAETQKLKQASDNVKSQTGGKGSLVPVVLGVLYLMMQ